MRWQNSRSGAFLVSINIGGITPFGTGLNRPECVLPTPKGDVYVPDWNGGVGVVRADGSTQSWLARGAGIELKPNGIALLRGGDFLIANLGEDGGAWRLGTDGGLRPFLTAIDGTKLPPANFIFVDGEERVWISVSTRQHPRQKAWRRDVADGFVVLVENGVARIAADRLHYTNEVRPDPAGRFLYVVETFGRRLLRYPILARGALGPAEIHVQFEAGLLPDGFAFDEEGGIWVTSLVSNRVLRINPKGGVEPMIADTNEAHVAAVEAAFAAGAMQKEHLGPVPGARFQHLTSIGFGGADRRQAFLGSLHGDCLYRFTAPVAGAAQDWWNFTLP
jgi:sugar lactone lactonase YvrE